MTNAPEGAFKIPNFIDQSELAKFGFLLTVALMLFLENTKVFH